jgi:hypothetical protein
MPNHLRVRSFALLLAGTFLVRNSTAAQGTIADRIRKIADDEKKALLADANPQVNSVVTDAAAAKVADGTFSAAFSPWTLLPPRCKAGRPPARLPVPRPSRKAMC